MSTNKERIAAYLPDDVATAFRGFKVEYGLGDSQALIRILTEYFEVSQQVTHSGDSELLQRIEALESHFSSLSQEFESVRQFKSELLGELEELKGLEKTLFGMNRSVSHADSPSELLVQEKSGESEIVSPLGSTNSVSAEKRKRGRPKGSRNPKSQIEADKNPGTLSTAELARRLTKKRTDTGTISRWKPGGSREKTPEELLEETRRRDPDGIGWIYLPEIDRFKSERELPSESLSDTPEVIQSELLQFDPQIESTP